MAGLINRVLPVAEPWRPLKFRLEECAEIISPTDLAEDVMAKAQEYLTVTTFLGQVVFNNKHDK
ncbi:MAG: hypothetical protein RLZZ148_793 [Cyanobacteriota bacterium]|jgi:hypothetical protein